MQAKIVEKFCEEQLMNQITSKNVCFADLEQNQNLENHGDGNSKPFKILAHQMVSFSSPNSCVIDLSNEMLDFSYKTSEWKIVDRRDYSDPSSKCNGTARGGENKKARIQPSSSQTTCKYIERDRANPRTRPQFGLALDVPKMGTIGEKINIEGKNNSHSPACFAIFCKTDTASVLLEAMGYIRFLQNQMKDLSQPYFCSISRNLRNQVPLEYDKKEEKQ